MADLFNGFIIPLIEIVFIGGIILGVCAFSGYGIYNAWKKKYKYIWKYQIKKKPISDDMMKWILSCIEKGVNPIDAKRLLLINMVDEDIVTETIFIYNFIMLKGGVKNDRQSKGSYSQAEIKRNATKFPNVSSNPTSSSDNS